MAVEFTGKIKGVSYHFKYDKNPVQDFKISSRYHGWKLWFDESNSHLNNIHRLTYAVGQFGSNYIDAIISLGLYCK